MRLFFFQNDGIVLDRSVHSRKRTIIPQERRPALAMTNIKLFQKFENEDDFPLLFLVIPVGLSTRVVLTGNYLFRNWERKTDSWKDLWRITDTRKLENN